MLQGCSIEIWVPWPAWPLNPLKYQKGLIVSLRGPWAMGKMWTIHGKYPIHVGLSGENAFIHGIFHCVWLPEGTPRRNLVWLKWLCMNSLIHTRNSKPFGVASAFPVSTQIELLEICCSALEHPLNRVAIFPSVKNLAVTHDYVPRENIIKWWFTIGFGSFPQNVHPKPGGFLSHGVFSRSP